MEKQVTIASWKPGSSFYPGHFHRSYTGASVMPGEPFFFLLFRAAPAAYGSSQTRGRIGATAHDLCHIPSNAGSKPCVQPTPQLMATSDP